MSKHLPPSGEFVGFGDAGRCGPYRFSLLLYRSLDGRYSYFVHVTTWSEESNDSRQTWSQKTFASSEEAHRQGSDAIRVTLAALSSNRGQSTH